MSKASRAAADVQTRYEQVIARAEQMRADGDHERADELAAGAARLLELDRRETLAAAEADNYARAHGEPIEQTTWLVGQPAADDLSGAGVHEVPVVDEPQALHVQPEDPASHAIIAVVESISEDEERRQTLLVNRRCEQIVGFCERQVTELACNRPLGWYGDADEGIALAVLTRATFEETKGAGHGPRPGPIT